MFDPVPEALDAIRAGRMVIVTDDANRENEGDLICAAELVTDASINFMATHGRGLICVALPSERVRSLGLTRMAMRGQGDAFNTAFLESVDAARGISTGISTHDRAETVRVLIDEASGSSDLVSPGHTFPLQAMDGGVLNRAGHTEAAMDLARLAGLRPAGVICEILRPDGAMARLPELRAFAREHGLKITSVADIIAYRRRTEKMVGCIRQVGMPTRHGDFQLKLFHSAVDDEHHVALVMGDITPEEPVLVRVHSECLTGDVFHSRRCDCGSQLEEAMCMVEEEGKGIVLYMRQEGRGIGLANKIHAYALQDGGLDTVEANEELGFNADLREYGIGAQILTELGAQRLRLITNNPCKIVGLEGYGLEIVERIPIVVGHHEHNKRYLDTKKEKLGHLL
ncbi:MAG: bifunctional 3,4-dihydroxy-2-butanone-4-phosphate synthase/GTP cyclohydrolase II [Lentisphaerae bacterium]|nr:bifunctional 3,4-dihydroxy-2-butanone-4-phosphate synthase/GTP cyclohydrolase II [Lentisphaerota bacterium]